MKSTVPAGKKIHDAAIKSYEDRGMLSQKDLMKRLGVSIRVIQRLRNRYRLPVKAYWGVNPLFTEQDVKRMERSIRIDRQRMAKRKSATMRRQWRSGQMRKAIDGYFQLRKSKAS